MHSIFLHFKCSAAHKRTSVVFIECTRIFQIAILNLPCSMLEPEALMECLHQSTGNFRIQWPHVLSSIKLFATPSRKTDILRHKIRFICTLAVMVLYWQPLDGLLRTYSFHCSYISNSFLYHSEPSTTTNSPFYRFSLSNWQNNSLSTMFPVISHKNIQHHNSFQSPPLHRSTCIVLSFFLSNRAHV